MPAASCWLVVGLMSGMDPLVTGGNLLMFFVFSMLYMALGVCGWFMNTHFFGVKLREFVLVREKTMG